MATVTSATTHVYIFRTEIDGKRKVQKSKTAMLFNPLTSTTQCRMGNNMSGRQSNTAHKMVGIGGIHAIFYMCTHTYTYIDT